MIAHRPSKKTLTLFATNFFADDTPEILFRHMAPMGEADIDQNRIYLNNYIPQTLRPNICMIGNVIYRPDEQFQFINGEQYFFVLLHEIGHFKIKRKAPKEFYNYKYRAINEIKSYEGLSKNRSTGLSWIARHFAAIVELADVRRKRGESWDHFRKRKTDFESWLLQDYNQSHKAVHDWAIEEFKIHRATIRRVVKSSK